MKNKENNNIDNNSNKPLLVCFDKGYHKDESALVVAEPNGKDVVFTGNQADSIYELLSTGRYYMKKVIATQEFDITEDGINHHVNVGDELFIFEIIGMTGFWNVKFHEDDNYGVMLYEDMILPYVKEVGM